MVKKTVVPAQIGEAGVFEKVGFGVASIFIILIFSDKVWQKSGLTASNFKVQQPGIFTKLAGMVKSKSAFIQGLLDGTEIKLLSFGFL